MFIGLADVLDEESKVQRGQMLEVGDEVFALRVEGVYQRELRRE